MNFEIPMPLTRKIVRKWQSLRLHELQHQYETVYLFAHTEEDANELSADLYAEWCELQTSAKMEYPPLYFVREYYSGLV